ncbi:segregation/condensation protein A [Candidatus Pacearchaeota archaeon]|nr:segregation/condensation protein A [Candidatus Pacearchaeota archaeon]
MDQIDKNAQKRDKIGQEQFHSFVFSDKMSWQEIIYDLINTEQLDPWDIDLAMLSQRYLERISELEEANFSLSSKVLLVASLMLRIKSELLMNYYIKSLDDILFGKKVKEEQQILNFDEYEEDEIPKLIPKTPLPRFKKISIQELISALDKAVKTENRRIFKKDIEKETYERTVLFMPKQSISLADRIKNIKERVAQIFQKQDKIAFSEFSGPKKEEKIQNFIPLLHLDNHNKLWLQQEKHLEEIWIHKSGEQFMQKDDIITNKLESQFEESLEEFEETEENFDEIKQESEEEI